jgi:hypothetical protein
MRDAHHRACKKGRRSQPRGGTALVAAFATALVATPLGGQPWAKARPAGVPEGGEPAGRLHATLDGTFTYGIGGWSALGGQLAGGVQVSLWNSRLGTGTFDVGGIIGLQGEPMALQFGAIRGQHNDAQRLNGWATAGLGFHLGQRRRSALGLQLFGGWTHVFSQASIVRPDLGIDRQVRDDYGVWNSGVLVKYSQRLGPVLGLTLQAALPFWGVQPSYVATLFHVGVGLVVCLR